MPPSGRDMRQRAQRRPSTGASRQHLQAVRAEPRSRYVARAGLVGPLLGGVAAAVGAVGTMALLRSTLQVRTVSERLLEWVLLLVPPGLIEAALQRFGSTLSATPCTLRASPRWRLCKHWGPVYLAAAGQ